VASTSAYEAPALSVRVIGSGPDVILIPGLGSPPEVYARLVERLKPTHRLHLVHLSGYAGRPANTDGGALFAPAVEAIATYMKSANLKNVRVIGHSLGGEAAMALAARHEGLVGHILVVDALPFYSLLFGPTVTPDLMRPRAEAFAASVKAQSLEAFTTAQKAAIARLVKSEADRATVLDWSLKSDRTAIAQGVFDLMTTDLRPELTRLTAKTTLLYAHDPAMGLPVAVVDGIYANAYATVPNFKSKRIDNALHFIMMDQPDAFEREFLAFLDQ
jgi:pimeloyl-[acyl-carrier protein] methyl ester esterase